MKEKKNMRLQTQLRNGIGRQTKLSRWDEKCQTVSQFLIREEKEETAGKIESQEPRERCYFYLLKILLENRLQIGNSEIELISRNLGRRRLLSGWILLRCQIYFTLSLSDLAQISDDFRDGVREEGTQKAGENVKLKDMRQIH